MVPAGGKSAITAIKYPVTERTMPVIELPMNSALIPLRFIFLKIGAAHITGRIRRESIKRPRAASWQRQLRLQL